MGSPLPSGCRARWAHVSAWPREGAAVTLTPAYAPARLCQGAPGPSPDTHPVPHVFLHGDPVVSAPRPPSDPEACRWVTAWTQEDSVGPAWVARLPARPTLAARVYHAGTRHRRTPTTCCTGTEMTGSCVCNCPDPSWGPTPCHLGVQQTGSARQGLGSRSTWTWVRPPNAHAPRHHSGPRTRDWLSLSGVTPRA